MKLTAESTILDDQKISNSFETLQKDTMAEFKITNDAITSEVIAREAAVNLLIDADAPSLTKIHAKSDRSYTDPDRTWATCSIVPLSDPPVVGIHNGFREAITNAEYIDGKAYLFYAISGTLSLKKDVKYTVSYWGRALSGNPTTCIGHRESSWKMYPKKALTAEWQLFTYTISVSQNITNYVLGFYINVATGASGSGELCGFKLTAGENVEEYKTQILQTANNVLIQATKNDTTASQGGQHLIQSLINVAPNGVTIDAAKVNINGTTIFSDGTSIQSRIDAVDVGGKNYLRGTENMAGWGTNNNTTIVNGVVTFPTVTANTWREIWPAKNFKYELIRNKTITFSAEVKAPSGQASILNLSIGLDNTETAYVRQKYRNQQVNFTGTGDWQKVSATANITDSWFTSGSGTVNFNNCWVTIRPGAWNTSWSSFQLKHLKLEIGNKATDWSPAPEDVEIGGRNRAALSYIWNRTAATYTVNGITFTNLGGGKFSATGTTTNSGDIWWCTANGTSMQLGSGGTYTYTIYPESGSMPSGMRLQVAESNSSGTWARNNLSEGGATTLTFTTNAGNHPYHLGFSAVEADVSINITFRLKFEEGNKSTDWSPAPEDVQAEIDEKKSVHTLSTSYSYSYANLLTYSAEGYNGGAWTVSSTSGVKVGDTVRLKCTVSNMSNAPVYVVGTVTEVVNSTSLKMTSHGLDTTIIDGGNILTNSIGANQIQAHSINSQHLVISDSTNLATANEFYSNSLPSDWYGAKPAISGGYIVKNVATNKYLVVTPYSPSSFKQYDEIYFEAYVKAANAGTVQVGIWGQDASKAYVSGSFAGQSFNFTTSETKITGTLSLNNNAHSVWNTDCKFYCLGFSDEKTTPSQIYVRKVIFRRKNAGELIVDGSITASKLDADNINVSNKLTIGSMTTNTQSSILNSNILVGGRNILLGTERSISWVSDQASGGFRVKDLYRTYLPVHVLFKVGDLVTFSFDWSTNATGGNFHLECGNVEPWTWGTIISSSGTRNSTSNYVDISSSNKSGHCVITYSINAAQAAAADQFQWFRIRTDGDDLIGKTITISNAKGEVGNKATDWSPAPEDSPKANITPFFSFTPYNTTADTGALYWNSFSQAASPTKVGTDGFIRLSYTNTGTTSIYLQHRPKAIPTLKPETMYTLMIEFGAVTKSGNAYLRCPDGGQGSTNATYIRDNGIAGTLDTPIVANTTVYKYFMSAPTTAASYNDYFGCCTRVDPSSSVTYEVRLSLYEGLYAGPYTTPYNKTIIDGGQIMTGTITANQIAANAITIGDMDTSTAAKVNNGDSALTKVNYYNRTCHVGNSSNTQTNLWRKFASYTETAINTDPFIIFDVMSSGDMSSYKRFGRLKAHIRTAGTKGTVDTAHCKLEWITRGEGITLGNFVLAYKATSGTDVKVELWCKCDGSWTGYRFNMVQEGDRINQSTSAKWTLYDNFTADGVASVTSGYTQVTSTDIDAARTTATTYITHIDNNGIRVHPSSTENNSVVINASGMEVFKDGTAAANSVAFYGDTARVGKEASGHASIKSDGLHVWTGAESTATNEAAFFGVDTNSNAFTRIGKSNTRHIEIKDGGIQIYQDSTNVMGHFGYGPGTTRTNGTSTAPYFTLGKRGTTITTVGNYSVAEGDCGIASGYSSHAEGSWYYISSAGLYGSAGTYYPTASGVGSHAEGEGTLASYSGCHAEGVLTVASGMASHAEGEETIASSQHAHAEGNKTQATSRETHAEGYGTIASNSYAHAEGCLTTASGECSHAGGYHTTATRNYQTVIGKYNSLTGSGTTSDPYISTNAAFIIGNGVTTTGKDIFTVDWSGNVNIPSTATYKINGVSIVNSTTRTTFTPASGANNATFGGSYYERYGNVVHVHVGISGLTAKTETLIYSLPDGCYPYSTVYAHGTGGAWNTLCHMEIRTNGRIYVRSEGTYCGADAIFII